MIGLLNNRLKISVEIPVTLFTVSTFGFLAYVLSGMFWCTWVWMLYIWYLTYTFMHTKRSVPADISKNRQNISTDAFNVAKIPKGEIDAIVIGSGIGGLYCAAFLAKAGKKVLVLEQHYVAGGTTHTFDEKGGYEFDVGLHYVNNYKLAEMLLDHVTLPSVSPIRFQPMGNEKDGFTYDTICIGEKLSFDCKKKTYFQDLVKKFPKEVEAIKKIKEIIQQSQVVMGIDLVCKCLPQFIWPIVKKLIPPSWWEHAERNGADMVHDVTKDKQLQAILLGRYGDIGGPPDQIPMCLHAAIGEAFAQDGGAYPIGGPAVIAKTLIPTIEATGGRVLVRARVDQILLEESNDGSVRACGVRVKGVDIRAKVVISGAGAYTTFKTLLPNSIKAHTEGIDNDLASKGAKLAPSPAMAEVALRNDEVLKCLEGHESVSHVYAFICLKGAQKDLKLPSKNFWMMDVEGPDYDVNKAANEYYADPHKGPLCFFFGFPSAKDPLYNERVPEKSVCLAFGETTAATFKEWDGTAIGKRGSDYEDWKKAIGDRMVKKVLEKFPELADKIDHVAYATPLTNKEYLNCQLGESLGVRLNPARLCDTTLSSLLRPGTHITDLYLTGQDAAIPGIFGAILGGTLTTNVLLGVPDVIANPRFFFNFVKMLYNLMTHMNETKKQCAV